METVKKTATDDSSAVESVVEERSHHSHSGTFVILVATAITVLVALLAFTIFGHSSGEKLTHQLETTSQNASDYRQ